MSLLASFSEHWKRLSDKKLRDLYKFTIKAEKDIEYLTPIEANTKLASAPALQYKSLETGDIAQQQIV